MAKVYNIAERLANANQKPEVVIDVTHTVKINNSMPAVMMLEKISKDKEKESAEMTGDVLTVALGKKAKEYIFKQEFTMPALSLITQAIFASLTDSELPEVGEEEEKK